MIGYADILLEDGLPPGQDQARGLVRQIREHGLLLHRLISDLLDYAKAEAGKMEVRRDEVAVAALVEELAARFRPLATRKGLGLRAGADVDLPVHSTPARATRTMAAGSATSTAGTTFGKQPGPSPSS
jgi:signal transduction histidine kinase